MKQCRKKLHYFEGKQCKECLKLWAKTTNYHQQWRDKNRMSVKQSTKKYADTHRDERNAYSRSYKKANRSKMTALQVKREAAKINRTPKWLTPAQLYHIQTFYDNAAALTKQFGIQVDVDHIVPLQGKNVSGLHVPWNLQIISHSHNMSKGNR